MTELFNRRNQTSLRRILRNRSTQAENKLWYYLKGENLGIKFRRQVGIDHYIVDFYCPELRLVVEVDGDSHGTSEAERNDDVRQKYLEALGLEVRRFTNSDVSCNIQGVLESIQQTIDHRKPPLTPPS